MSNAAIRKAMENVEASLNMEGMVISDTCKELCHKIMNKEITFEEYLKMIIADEVQFGSIVGKLL